MFCRRLTLCRRCFALLAIALTSLLAVVPAGPVWAAPPDNDTWQTATTVNSLPFSATENTAEATLSADEKYLCQVAGHTVWFAYTPERDSWLVADTFGSDFDTVLAIWTVNSGTGTWSGVACRDNYARGKTTSDDARARFRATAGTTYYFQVGGYLNASGNLTFHLGRR